MNHLRTATNTGLLALVLALGACSSQPMQTTAGETATSLNVALSASLFAQSEVPPVMSTASGTMEAYLNKRTNLLSWTVTYAGLSGPATAAHFHGPAAVGQNAGVVVPMTGSLVNPIVGSATITAAQVPDLMAGKWYVNVHTAASPGGEIRGQVIVKP